MGKSSKIGIQGLLHPEDRTVVLIGQQSYLFTNLNSPESTMVLNPIAALAKTA